MNIYKRTAYSVPILVVSAIGAFLGQLKYQEIVAAIYKYFQHDKLILFGKFPLFPTWTFAVSFAIACVVIFNFLVGLNAYRKIMCIAFSILAFSIALVISCYLNSTVMVGGCTACQNGILTTSLSSIEYDTLFIISLVAPVTTSIIHTSRIRRK